MLNLNYLNYKIMEILLIFGILFLSYVIVVAIDIYQAKKRNKKKACIVLSEHYSLNLKENLLINGLLIETHIDKTKIYHNIYELYFNTNGEIFVMKEANRERYWQHFSDQGKNLGIITNKELKELSAKNSEICYGYCKEYYYTSDDRLIIYLE